MIARGGHVGWTFLVRVGMAFGVAASMVCSAGTPAPRPVGAVGLSLRLAGGAGVDRVDFTITGNGITAIRGDISVVDAAATATAFVGGITAARGYRIEMTASSTDGQVDCAGSAAFDILVDRTTSVGVGMQCRAARDAGGVIVGGTINNCPVLTAVVVSPISVPIGQVIALGAQASDVDPLDTITFRWMGTGGMVADLAGANTTFRCSGAGAQTVTVTASDGACDDTISVGVTCVAPRCGNGVVESGEQCDPPVGNSCDLSCQRVTICGNGVVERTEECDPPNGATCDAACRRIAPASTGGRGGSTATGGGGGNGGRDATGGGGGTNGGTSGGGGADAAAIVGQGGSVGSDSFSAGS